MPQSIKHDPGETGPFFIDWGSESDFLTEVDDTINSSSWEISPSGEFAEVSNAFNALTTKLVGSGGTDGTKYYATNEITTATYGYTFRRTIEIVCGDL